MKTDEIIHYGTPRHSGRYPWGSGRSPFQHERDFIFYCRRLAKEGKNEKDIAAELGMTINQLRDYKTIALESVRRDDTNTALKLKDKGWSNSAIAARLDVTEGTVRNLLRPVQKERKEITKATAEVLKKQISEKSFIDIGAGIEHYMGISSTKLRAAVQMLVDEGYTKHYIQVKQAGTGKMTSIKVLAPPDASYSEVYKNRFDIKLPFGNYYTEDGGRTWLGIEPPKSVNSKRVAINWAEDGGKEKDGIIELRRGVSDLSLGSAQYGQVRIAVDGTHFLKGMAVYSDNLPDGIDIRFNTNKHKSSDKKDAMKPMKEDEDNVFGATVRQHHYVDKNGNTQLSALNIVASGEMENVEGRWSQWSKSLANQFLSKQSPALAKKQLDISYDIKKEEFDEIMSLTNPVVKRKLLLSFADDCDSSAVHLDAAALPRQTTSVILPVTSLKDNEIYAPNYNNGEIISLVRFPHGGIFEIPQLIVNNKNKEANRFMKNAKDAVGINSKVAEQLSGADFDGDNVLTIPTNGRIIRHSSPLEGLKNFDPKELYKLPDSAPNINERTKNIEMGKISNLITDMTIKNATSDEICRAVRHSMVVIDSLKHHLDYRQSAADNGIAQLKEKYQGGARAGVSTLLSRAKHAVKVEERKEFNPNRDIDPETGEKRYVLSGRTSINKKGEIKKVVEEVPMMSLVSDAYALSSGSKIESVYAEHANRLKQLGNTARKEYLNTKPIERSSSASTLYKKEVESLKAKVSNAQRNAPLERQAQLLANKKITDTIKSNPQISADDLKKIRGQALNEARSRVGAKKERVNITENEWKAIQSGAISTTFLESIINNTDLDLLKQLATPRTSVGMTSAKLNRAKSMLNLGYTQSEVAAQLGVSVSTLQKSMKDEV